MSALHRRWPRRYGRLLVIGLLVLGGATAFALRNEAVATPTATTAGRPEHRVVYQVSSNDPASMQHALSSADNAFKLYRSRAERVTIEIVANGGGVHMMRSDTTPVAAMLHYMQTAYPTNLILSACGTSKGLMEAKEGRPVPLLDGVRIVPAGIVRVIELQEQGYAYVKP